MEDKKEIIETIKKVLGGYGGIGRLYVFDEGNHIIVRFETWHRYFEGHRDELPDFEELVGAAIRIDIVEKLKSSYSVAHNFIMLKANEYDKGGGEKKVYYDCYLFLIFMEPEP
jgi:hypothetical protein